MTQFQDIHAKTPAKPYYSTRLSTSPPQHVAKRADAVISNGFVHSGYAAFPLDVPIDWTADPYSDRSWRFWLNSLEPLGIVLMAHTRAKDPRYLHFAEQIACDWASQHDLRQTENPFAWYDMAVGLRALKLAYIADAAARDPDTEPEILAQLLVACWIHGWHLSQEEYFQRHTNHGIFQAAGLLALGKSLPELEGAGTWRDLGERRLRVMFGQSFTPEGVHLEHSPGYHLSMLSLLGSVLTSGLISDPMLTSLRAKAADCLTWMIAPDGTLPRIGDTGLSAVTKEKVGLPERHIPPGLLYVVSRGRAGTMPALTHRIFPEAGYAVFRDRWGTPDDWQETSYLFFSAAFHSRTHKHADDLTFEWWHRGTPVLVDAGRYGYYYDDPNRIYCESTRAHNTVEIDGRDYSRHRPQAFGSALSDWGEGDSLYFVSAEIERQGDIFQRRTIVWKPRSWLMVVDEFRSRRPHDYTQWFHFHPDLDLSLHDDVATVQLGDSTVLSIQQLSRNPSLRTEAVRGQREPRMQGWTSLRHRELEPNYALGYAMRGRKVVFAALLSVDDSSLQNRKQIARLHVEPESLRITWTGSTGTDGFVLDRGGDSAAIRSLGIIDE